MCKAFSCVIGRDKKVTWKFGTDSHEDLIRIAGYKDDTLDPEKIEFCRIEISPMNGSYMEPDKWSFRIDMDVTPAWWTLPHKRACEREHKKWMKELGRVLIRKAIIHPFKIDPPEITEVHIALLREWASVRASVMDSVRASVRASVRDSVRDSVWDSVGASVWASVRDSVWDSVWDSVRDSVWDSVRASVRNSVRDSVGAYIGSFFILERSAWKYTENVDLAGYPFQPVVALWECGLVASFDGKKWRLHGGPNGQVLWEGDLK